MLNNAQVYMSSIFKFFLNNTSYTMYARKGVFAQGPPLCAVMSTVYQIMFYHSVLYILS